MFMNCILLGTVVSCIYQLCLFTNSNTHFCGFKVPDSYQYYTIIDFNEVDIRIYLPEKVITRRELKSITVLLYDFSFQNENFASFTFVVKDMFNLQS